MKKSFLIAISSLCVLISCQNEELEELSSENLIVYTVHYKGKTYDLSYSESGEDLQLIGEVPEELNKLAELPELATVIDGNDIFAFDNEREKFEHYGIDYSEIQNSRKGIISIDKKNIEPISKSVASSSSNIVYEFNSKAKFYIDSYWGGSRLNITSMSQLRNLKNASFNDKISSINISPSFQNPLNVTGSHPSRRTVICYEHADFDGRSVEFTSSFYYQYYGGSYYYGHRRLKSLSIALFKNFNDRISSIDIIQYGSSLVGSNTGGGGSSGGGGSNPPIENYE